jgi:hypothetical protein
MLDNLAKVNIVVGPKPADTRSYFAALNVAIVYSPRFNFVRYFSLSRSAQQRLILKTVHQTLLRIARRTDAETDWYQSAFLAIRQLPCPLPDVPEPELRRRWRLVPRKRKR